MGYNNSMKQLKILIVGAGPSACYVVDALTKTQLPLTIDMIDRYPQPLGLLRTGVAPDHERIKSLDSYFNKILDQAPLNFYGNVSFGKDIVLDDVKNAYHAIFFCTGTESDNPVPGLDYTLVNVTGSRDVVEWYNGYESNRTQFNPELLGSSVGIIGMGNVALDIARILLKNPQELAKTEMPQACIDTIQNQAVGDVYIFARRGPAQAKCTPLELEELLDLANVQTIVYPSPIALSDTDQIEINDTNRVQKNVNLFTSIKANTTAKKRLHIYFYSQLKEVHTDADKLQAITLAKTILSGEPHHQQTTLSDETYHINLDSLITSTGYKGAALPGIVFNEKTHCIPHESGKITTQPPSLASYYCAGWIKRGPQGVIGTNKAGAKESVDSFVNDVEHMYSKQLHDFNLGNHLKNKQCSYFSLENWQTQNTYELSEGQKQNKKRLKLTQISDIEHCLKTKS